MEFWRDTNMDNMINDIIDIFTKVEGVELVRLSGLTNRERKISNTQDLKPEVVDNIVKKLKSSGVINYCYITICPCCNEKSYQIKPLENNAVKSCDTCKVMYTLADNYTLFRDKDDELK